MIGLLPAPYCVFSQCKAYLNRFLKKYWILDKKYASRPRFEDDDDIVSAFTEYGQTQEQIKQLQRELAVLQG